MCKRIHCALLAVTLLVLLAGCKEGTVSPVLTGDLDGQVLDSDSSTPLTGASVTTAPPTDAVVTDEQGRFSIPDLEVGTYTISARKPGYAANSVSVRVRENRTTGATIFLEKAPPGDTTTEASMSAEITSWWNRTSSDSAFVNVEYRVRNIGAKDIDAYEIYFRIVAGEETFYHEETGEDLRANQSNVRQFEKYIRSTPADDVVVEDLWVE
ncbi:MAG TPA: carboxypeptidase-like regulatory domain-containing protein [Rhodothermales bacterium]